MFKVGIIATCDTEYAKQREDQSVKVIREIVEKEGYEVTYYRLMPDERHLLSKEMSVVCDMRLVDLLFTAGGTGLSVKDCMPEATLDVIDKAVPGIPEMMRYASQKEEGPSMLTRGVAGIRNHTLIINLPESPNAIKRELRSIIHTLPQGLKAL